MNKLTGLRTHLMGAGIIVHQGLKFFGIDVGDELISNTIDAVLALGAIWFRWLAALNTKKEVETARAGG